MQRQFILILNSKSYFIPSQFPKLDDISANIYKDLIDNQKYIVKSFVKEDVFESFIQYLIDNKKPDINFQNKHDFSLLSQEFNIMGNVLLSFQGTIDQYLSELQILNQSDQDTSQTELNIAENLDDFILNCGERLLQSPIQSLYSIFNHKDRKFTQHNLCYDLIKRNYEQNNNLNIFVLLTSIDAQKLSRENLIDSIEKRIERGGMMPNYDSSIVLQNEKEIDTLKQKNDLLQSRIIEMTQIIRELRFNLMEEHESDHFRYNFFVPLGQKWTKITPTNYTLNYQDQTYEVIVSATWENRDNHGPQNLFTGKNEKDGDNRWATQIAESDFLQINFSTPKCANVLSLTSRNCLNNQAPILFEVYASNDKSNFTFLRRFGGVEWANNEKKQFLFQNNTSFTSYKIVLLESKAERYHFGLSSLNFGEIL